MKTSDIENFVYVDRDVSYIHQVMVDVIDGAIIGDYLVCDQGFTWVVTSIERNRMLLESFASSKDLTTPPSKLVIKKMIY